MAIQKTKTLPSGVSGNYWKITGVVIDKPAMAATYKISLFLDAAHAAGRGLGLTKVFSTPVTSEQLEGDVLALGYDIIKTQAARIIEVDITGQPCSPRAFDADLDNGVDV